jgi:hypothetical protein
MNWMVSLFVSMFLCLALSGCVIEQGDEEGSFSSILTQEEVGESADKLSSCTVSGVAFNTWYSQNNPSWKSVLLGKSSSQTIGGVGCVITSLAMAYNDVWGKPTTPDQLNTSAKSAGCFGLGSALVDVQCAINSRGGPHVASDISMSSVPTALCAGHPVMVDVTWGGGHKMLVYRYNGGNTTSLGSYEAVDPWTGTSKFLTSYTATRWRELK